MNNTAPQRARKGATTTRRNRRESAPRFRLCGEDSPRRRDVENFVARTYRRAYEARVTHFLPTILALETHEGSFLGAIGMREARVPGRLFLESYLDLPVESVLSRRLGRPVQREAIAEVGNLAGSTPGAGSALISSLAAFLDALEVDWALFTGTKSLLDGFRHLGIQCVDLGPADGSVLGDNLADWGTYYETDPRVTAVFIPQVRVAVESRRRLAKRLESLWTDAFRAGCDR